MIKTDAKGKIASINVKEIQKLASSKTFDEAFEILKESNKRQEEELEGTIPTKSFTHNGMTCYYYETNNPYEMERLSKELIEFTKFFFDVEHEDWSGVYDDQAIYDFFVGKHYIHNELVDKVSSILEIATLEQKQKSFSEAFEEARKELKGDEQ